MEVLISIITVVKNNAQPLAVTLNSVASLPKSLPIEHVVIDGASTDGTLELLLGWELHLLTIISEPDKGLYDAMNKGLDLAKGHFCLFLNSGDSVDPEMFSFIVERVCDLRNILVFFPVRIVGSNLSGHCTQVVPKLSALRGLCVPHHQGTLYPRSYYSYERYDLAFARQADYDFTLRGLASHKYVSCDFHRPVVTSYFGGFGSAAFMSNRGMYLSVKESWGLAKKHTQYFGFLFYIFILLAKLFKRFLFFIGGENLVLNSINIFKVWR